MESGSSSEMKQDLNQMVEFPPLLLPSNIFSHLDKHYSIPDANQIKTAIIRMLSLRTEWTVFQFIKEIHARSLQSNFSMRIVLLYAAALVVKPLLAQQYSNSKKIIQNAPYFISLVYDTQFKVAGVMLQVPKQYIKNTQSIKKSLITTLKGIGIEVIERGKDAQSNHSLVGFDSDYFGLLRMPSQIIFQLKGKMSRIELFYKYNVRGHPNLGGNPLKLDDFMRLGRHVRCGQLAGLQLQQAKLFKAFQQLVTKTRNNNHSYLVLSTDNIFIYSVQDCIELKANLDPVKGEESIPINFFQCTTADRSIFLKNDFHLKYADYYSVGILFLEAIAIKRGIEWFRIDLEKNLGILARKIVLEEFIDYIQEEKYFTDREAIGKLRKWLHLDESFLKHHPYFDYSGQFEKAIQSFTADSADSKSIITPHLKSLISKQANLDKVINQKQILIDLGFASVNAQLLVDQNCPTCHDGRFYESYCKHKFCLNCYYQSLQQQLLKSDTSPIPTTCSREDCQKIMPANVIWQLLSNGPDKRVLTKTLMRNLLTEGSYNINSYCYCIKDIWLEENEEHLFYQKKNKQVFICYCNESRCTSCQLFFHMPMTCSQFEKQQEHILEQVERQMKTLKIQEITNKILKICNVLKLNNFLSKIGIMPLLVREWLRIYFCFALKSPKSQLGAFFEDLIRQTSKKMQILYTQEKQLLINQKINIVGQLSIIIGMRNSFLLSILL